MVIFLDVELRILQLLDIVMITGKFFVKKTSLGATDYILGSHL